MSWVCVLVEGVEFCFVFSCLSILVLFVFLKMWKREGIFCLVMVCSGLCKVSDCW